MKKKAEKSNNAETPSLNIAGVSGSDKLILLKRVNPTEYEIHRGEIRQTKNLILTTTDSDFAHKLVNAYNHYR